MSKSIKVTLFIDVPEEATDDDIQDWIHVELEGVNSMKQDNPCIDDAIVNDSEWEYD